MIPTVTGTIYIADKERTSGVFGIVHGDRDLAFHITFDIATAIHLSYGTAAHDEGDVAAMTDIGGFRTRAIIISHIV